MPALKAARTAFTCPRVNETATVSGRRLGGGLSVGEGPPAPSLRLSEHDREQSVKLPIIKVLDRVGQVPGQDVSRRGSCGSFVGRFRH